MVDVVVSPEDETEATGHALVPLSSLVTLRPVLVAPELERSEGGGGTRVPFAYAWAP